MKEKYEKSIRKSNIELLRITAILMVIGLHYLNSNMGGALGVLKPGDMNYYIAYFLQSSCIIAVNLFITITGYFFINNLKPKISKVIGLVLIAYFYGAFLYIISVMLKINEFKFIDMIKSTNFLLIKNYWFIKIYAILYLISPFINVLLNNITQKMHKSLIVIMLIFFSIWPSFAPRSPNNDKGYGIITFILLYIIGAYIRKYYDKKASKLKCLLCFIICMIITYIFSIVVNGYENPWQYNFVFNVCETISLFLFFYQLNIKSKLIN